LKSTILSIFLFLPILCWSQITFEGDPVPISRLNTPDGQNYLVLSPFENAMAFTEERGGEKLEKEEFKAYERDILESNWKIYIFPDWLKEKGMLSPLGFDNDGGLYYSQTFFDKGIYKGIVKRADSKGNIEEVSIPFLKNKAPIQNGCLSADGQFMILSMESNNTNGVEDLYVVRRKEDGTWSSASNLGASINTKFQEITPFISADNKTLFFATNGRGGEGSFDIFHTVRQDDSWRSWSTPINIGSDVNTIGAETSFSFLDGDQWAYFVSSKDSDGYGDIMRIKIEETIEADTTTAGIAETIVSLGNEPVDVGIEDVTISLNEEPVDVGVEDVIISIDKEPVDVGVPELTVKVKERVEILLKIVDAENGNSLSSELIVEGERTGNMDGLFFIDSMSNVEVEVKSKGYLPKLVVLSELKRGENVIAMESVSVGHTIQLDHVLFHRGTSDMVAGSEKELNLVVEVMNDNPEMKILLKGHTDNTGDQVVNRRLSEARVKTVRAYLLDQGINAYRIRGKGYGGNVPLVSNATEETRKLNRRVEFEVIED
jgi:OmpA-OmpF porin, OOP family